VPESFNVLVNELKALGLNIIPKGVVEKKPEEPTEGIKEAEELAKAAGATIVNDVTRDHETNESLPES
jgi:50S ribosomal subunit-associated GTPase HflX